MFPPLLTDALFCAYRLEASALATTDQATATHSWIGCCGARRQDFVVDVWSGVDRRIENEDLKDLYGCSQWTAELFGSITVVKAVSASLQISTAVDSEFGRIRRVRIILCPIGLSHLCIVGILSLRRSSLTLWFRPVVGTGMVGLLLDMR